MSTHWTYCRVHDGDWIRYKDVPFGAGYRRLQVVYGSNNPQPKAVEARLDAPDGPVLVVLPLAKTDRRDPRDSVWLYDALVADLQGNTTGTHDVYFTFRADNRDPVGEFHYLQGT